MALTCSKCNVELVTLMEYHRDGKDWVAQKCPGCGQHFKVEDIIEEDE